METKACRKCGEVKLVSLFTRYHKSADGLYSYCKVCKYADHVTRREANPARYKQKQAEADRRWRLAHPDKHSFNKKRWAKNNPDKLAAQRKAWHDQNREKVRLKIRIANARRRSNGMRYPVAVIARLMKVQHGKCAICKVDIRHKFHIDHILPLALGGENLPRNVQLLCPPCNSSKRHKHPIDFMQSRGFLL